MNLSDFITLKRAWSRALFSCALCCLTLLGSCTHLGDTKRYDIVLAGGRVIDPESGLDAVRNIGIRGQTIVAVTSAPISGTRTVNVTGLVVAPGFIDIHSHSPTPFGARQQLFDGVTTQLDLEAGAFPVSAYGEYFDQGAPVNFGASVSHLAVRTKVLTGEDRPYLFSRKGDPPVPEAFTQKAKPAEIQEMRTLLDQGLKSGGIGIGILLDYASQGITPEELQMIFEVAAKHQAPVTVHVRRGMPGDAKGLDEVIELAVSTKVPLLICHISHSAMQGVDNWLAKIDAANARGARISAETLTYAAGGTAISAAVFDRDWQSIFKISYSDVQWTATGERLTEESFHRYRREQPGGMVNHHYVSEEWIRTALRWPKIMVVSDATPAFEERRLSSPNLSGTFSRFLGQYVRIEGILSLPAAIARTSLHQAQWLEHVAPAFKRKGRIRIGMDADIVAFDPTSVEEKATYGRPFERPVGIRYVLVAGKLAVSNGQLEDTEPVGQRIVADW